jgi:hypothetical protein
LSVGLFRIDFTRFFAASGNSSRSGTGVLTI